MDDFFHGELGLGGSLVLRSPESFIETTHPGMPISPALQPLIQEMPALRNERL